MADEKATKTPNRRTLRPATILRHVTRTMREAELKEEDPIESLVSYLEHAIVQEELER